MFKKVLLKSLMYLIFNKVLFWWKYRYMKIVKLEEVGFVKRYYLKFDLFCLFWFFNWYCCLVCWFMNCVEIKLFKKKIRINMIMLCKYCNKEIVDNLFFLLSFIFLKKIFCMFLVSLIKEVFIGVLNIYI